MNKYQFYNISNQYEFLNLDSEELVKFFWHYKNQEKENQRNKKYWEASLKNLENAYQNLYKKEKELENALNILHSDLEVANKMQKTLLPEIQTGLQDEYSIAIYHQQLNIVGGDYYDVFKDKNGRDNIIVLDICGHGVSAALLMVYLKAQFMEICKKYSSPAKIVNSVNTKSIKLLNDLKKYATISFISLRDNSIRYICGGGNGMLLHNDTIISLKKEKNFLGLRENLFVENKISVQSGDVLAVYTDGIIESKNSQNENYTKTRLHDIIRKNSDKQVNDILQLCIQDYNAFKENNLDDATLIIMKKN